MSWRPRSVVAVIVLPALLTLPSCKPDDSPFRAENDALKKQLTRQESLVTSLQDGNRVMQQQIDLLNQEIRDAKKSAESAKAEAKAAAEQLDQQLVQARKLTADIKKTALEQAAQNIHIEQKGAQFEDLPRPLHTVTKTVEEALARNGYQVRVSIKADQKAVIVTDRKISNPASLEVAGFRNQYVIAVQAQPLNVTRLSVKAEFEKLAQGGRILSVSPEETAEIERRLIGEVSKALAAPSKT
jgi:F0F1-type ATP synthase membrane subunit b/b'